MPKPEHLAKMGVSVIDGLSRSAASVALFFAVSMMAGTAALFWFGLETLRELRLSIEEVGKQMRTGDKEIVTAIQSGGERTVSALQESYRGVIQAIGDTEAKRDAALARMIEVLREKR